MTRQKTGTELRSFPLSRRAVTTCSLGEVQVTRESLTSGAAAIRNRCRFGSSEGEVSRARGEDEMNLGLHLLILSLADEERAYRLWWKLKEKYRLFASPRDILGITLRLIEEQLDSEEAPKVIKAIGREAGATPITYFNCRGSGP